MSGIAAVRRLEEVLKRLRSGPRLIALVTDEPEVVDRLTRWASIGRAVHEVRPHPDGSEVCLYLLPTEFGEHPFLAWRPTIPDASDVLTPEGVHLTIGA
ncbi:MAG: hypothetical protein ABMB14_20565 [Myxococcota bacterium]